MRGEHFTFHFSHVVAKLPTSWASSPYFHFTHVVAKQANGSQSTEARTQFPFYSCRRETMKTTAGYHMILHFPFYPCRRETRCPCRASALQFEYFHFTHVVEKRQSLTSTSTVFHFTHVVAKLHSLSEPLLSFHFTNIVAKPFRRPNHGWQHLVFHFTNIVAKQALRATRWIWIFTFHFTNVVAKLRKRKENGLVCIAFHFTNVVAKPEVEAGMTLTLSISPMSSRNCLLKPN